MPTTPFPALFVVLLSTAAHALNIMPRAIRATTTTMTASLNDDWAAPMEVATKKTMRQVASYRSKMEAEVENLRSLLESTSKEVEQAASSVGTKLPEDWAAPMQMATSKTMRQVALYGTKMEAEVEQLQNELDTATAAIASLQAELDGLREKN